MSWFESRPATHPDRRLVDRLLAGDEAAFEEFVDAYLQGIFRFALSRLGERELARDIAQSTMVQAIEKLDSYRGEAPLFQWLCTVCRSQISAHFRRRNRRPEESLDTGRPGDPEGGSRAASLTASGDDPETALARLQEAAQVHTTLDDLPEHYRQALTWKYHDEMTTQDIADRLGLTAKAAESLLTRARQAFRRDFAASSR